MTTHALHNDKLATFNTLVRLISALPRLDPFGLRPYRTAPAGSIPAGDMRRYALHNDNLATLNALVRFIPAVR